MGLTEREVFPPSGWLHSWVCSLLFQPKTSVPCRRRVLCCVVLCCVVCRWCPDLRAVKLHTADPEERKRLKREVCTHLHAQLLAPACKVASDLHAKSHYTCMQRCSHLHHEPYCHRFVTLLRQARSVCQNALPCSTVVHCWLTLPLCWLRVGHVCRCWRVPTALMLP
jgi:hypothetical protein